MDSIEAKIHNILLDIDPSLCNDYEEQAIIVAHATANYKIATSKEKIKTAATQDDESIIIDSLLKAINNLAEKDNGRFASNDYGYYFNQSTDEVDYEDVLRNLRYSSKDFGDMSVINDDDLDLFLENDKEDDGLFSIDDGCEDHDSELYDLLGIQRKHRSDSIVR